MNPAASRGAAPGVSAAGTSLGTVLSIARYHIMLVAMAAVLAFGWLMTGRYTFWLAPLVGLDWFLINLLNRATDVEEDLRNQIAGTAEVARRRRAVVVGCFLVMGASFLLTWVLAPRLLGARLAVQAIGVAYSYRLVPTPRGLKRLKEIYFLKNFGSALLFVLTCVVYPLALAPSARSMSWAGVAVLVGFFVPFEMTYEVLYDLRDLEGDRAAHIPTFPVVHGEAPARRIIDGMLLASVLVLVGGFLARAIGARELLLTMAPVTQLAFYRPRLRRGLTARDCILVTHLGTAQLSLFLVGTALWLRLGLPANLWP